MAVRGHLVRFKPYKVQKTRNSGMQININPLTGAKPGDLYWQSTVGTTIVLTPYEGNEEG